MKSADAMPDPAHATSRRRLALMSPHRGYAVRSRWRGLTLAAALLVGSVGWAKEIPNEAVLPWGDQGDGTYRNPVLFADYSDPDVIRVGDDFYLVASDFHFIGIQVLHSRDLVNWKIVGQVYSRLSMAPKYDQMAGYSEGTWAPALRYHEGKFYLYVCTPHDGLFLWTAEHAEGPWSEVVTVKAVDGWEDPCPFWDDDGQAYLVHSKKGAGPLILHRLSADGRELLDEGKVIYTGHVAEGPKLFKRKGWYYISLPEGGVDRGGQTVLRSRNLYGPYERREVLPAGSPHQGGIVTLDSSESWFIGFKSTGFIGRVCHLLPMRWGDDDWPIFGRDGQPVESASKPKTAHSSPIAHPQTSDDFSSASLGLQWQWNHNPVPESWSLTQRRGWLRLHGLPAAEIVLARNTLTQKLWGLAGAFDVELDTSHLSDGQQAGLAFMSGKVFATVGVKRSGEHRSVVWAERTGPEVNGVVWLRGVFHGDEAKLYYSLDGTEFRDTGLTSQLKFGQWKGARAAIYAFGPGGGFADFDNFVYHYEPIEK